MKKQIREINLNFDNSEDWKRVEDEVMDVSSQVWGCDMLTVDLDLDDGVLRRKIIEEHFLANCQTLVRLCDIVGKEHVRARKKEVDLSPDSAEARARVQDAVENAAVALIGIEKRLTEIARMMGGKNDEENEKSITEANGRQCGEGL